VTLLVVIGCTSLGDDNGTAPTVVGISEGPTGSTATTFADRAPLTVSAAVATALAEAASDNGLVRWDDPMLEVHVTGTPTSTDVAVLGAALEELGALAGVTLVEVATPGPEPDIEVLFAPRPEWPTELQDITDHVLGVTSSMWDQDGALIGASVAVDATIGQAARNQTIVHEMVHALGIGHVACPTSIVHGGPTGSPEWTLSALDRDLVRTWYDPGLDSGEDATEVTERLTVVPGGPDCEPQLLESAESAEGTVWCELTPAPSDPCVIVDGTGPAPLVPLAPIAERWNVDGVLYDHDPLRYEAFVLDGRRLLCERQETGRWPCQFTDGPGPLSAVDAWTDGELVYDEP
jgi:hypothetical protein